MPPLLEQPPKPEQMSAPITAEDVEKAFGNIVSPEEREKGNTYARIRHSALIDQTLFDKVLKGKESQEQRQTREAFRHGREVYQEPVGAVSANSLTRRIYEGDEMAYVKSLAGESFFIYDEATRSVRMASRGWNATKQGMELVERSLTKDEQALADASFGHLLTDREKVLKSIAKYYGVEPGELPVLNPKELSMRHGVEARTSVEREYFFSSINQLVRFGVIPLTVLRAESNGCELLSVQEAITETDPLHPPEHATYNTYRAVLEQGSTHPGAQSFMRLACLDYLLKMHDRNPENLIYNPATHQFFGIDNSICMGLSQFEMNDGQMKSRPVNEYISVPLEIVAQHDDWKLDGEARTELKRVYDSIMHYLQYRKEIKVGTRPDLGRPEAVVFSELFRLLFQNDSIAKLEGRDFLHRLKYLIDYGRPPELGSWLNTEVSQKFYEMHPETTAAA